MNFFTMLIYQNVVKLLLDLFIDLRTETEMVIRWQHQNLQYPKGRRQVCCL